MKKLKKLKPVMKKGSARGKKATVFYKRASF